MYYANPGFLDFTLKYEKIGGVIPNVWVNSSAFSSGMGLKQQGMEGFILPCGESRSLALADFKDANNDEVWSLDFEVMPVGDEEDPYRFTESDSGEGIVFFPEIPDDFGEFPPKIPPYYLRCTTPAGVSSPRGSTAVQEFSLKKLNTEGMEETVASSKTWTVQVGKVYFFSLRFLKNKVSMFIDGRKILEASIEYVFGKDIKYIRLVNITGNMYNVYSSITLKREQKHVRERSRMIYPYQYQYSFLSENLQNAGCICISPKDFQVPFGGKLTGFGAFIEGVTGEKFSLYKVPRPSDVIDKIDEKAVIKKGEGIKQPHEYVTPDELLKAYSPYEKRKFCRVGQFYYHFNEEDKESAFLYMPTNGANRDKIKFFVTYVSPEDEKEKLEKENGESGGEKPSNGEEKPPSGKCVPLCKEDLEGALREIFPKLLKANIENNAILQQVLDGRIRLLSKEILQENFNLLFTEKFDKVFEERFKSEFYRRFIYDAVSIDGRVFPLFKYFSQKVIQK